MARTILWLLCFAGAFFATHRPPSPEPGGLPIHDKVLHAAGFALLAGATAWRFQPVQRELSATRALVMLAGLSLYGAIDELTQPPFGRSCDLGDWTADVFGALAGLSLARHLFARGRAREPLQREDG